MKKHSKQRDAICAALRSVKTHPTATEIYDMVRVEFPHISLATVYRNLSELSRNGGAITIVTGDGTTRFDAMTQEHSHFCCTECGRVYDKEFPVNIDASYFNDCVVNRCSIILYGKCAECIN